MAYREAPPTREPPTTLELRPMRGLFETVALFAAVLSLIAVVFVPVHEEATCTVSPLATISCTVVTRTVWSTSTQRLSAEDVESVAPVGPRDRNVAALSKRGTTTVLFHDLKRSGAASASLLLTHALVSATEKNENEDVRFEGGDFSKSIAPISLTLLVALLLAKSADQQIRLTFDAEHEAIVVSRRSGLPFTKSREFGMVLLDEVGRAALREVDRRSNVLVLERSNGPPLRLSSTFPAARAAALRATAAFIAELRAA